AQVAGRAHDIGNLPPGDEEYVNALPADLAHRLPDGGIENAVGGNRAVVIEGNGGKFHLKSGAQSACRRMHLTAPRPRRPQARRSHRSRGNRFEAALAVHPTAGISAAGGTVRTLDIARSRD